MPYAKAISAWFDDRRGLALGVAMAGVGLGAIIMPQIALIELVGWRSAYVGLGVITFAVAFPAVALMIREPDALEGSGKASATLLRRSGVTAREAARSAQFWLMAGVFLLAGGGPSTAPTRTSSRC